MSVRSPSPVPHVFTDRSIFSLNLTRILDPHRNLTDQLQSQARTNVDMSTWCRHVHGSEAALFYPYRSVLMQAGTGLFRGKSIQNRLVCKNAIALAYYGSCRLLVMGSCVSWIYVQFLIGLVPLVCFIDLIYLTMQVPGFDWIAIRSSEVNLL